MQIKRVALTILTSILRFSSASTSKDITARKDACSKLFRHIQGFGVGKNEPYVFFLRRYLLKYLH